MPEQIKLVTTTAKGTRILVPVTINRTDAHIEFVKSSFALKNEIKAMQGSRWLGFDDPPRKIWIVANSERNRFQLRCMQGENPYSWWDRPLVEHTYERPLYSHQKLMTDRMLTYHYGIMAAEAGTGKTLSSIEAMEKSGITDWWWVGPKSGIAAVEREFEKWDFKLSPQMFTYNKFTTIMANWTPGEPAPQGVIFDESSYLRSFTVKRTRAAQALADAIRAEHGYEGYVTLMSGTPSPKTPVNWWSQCLSGDTWVLTDKGPTQIISSLGVKTNVRVGGSTYSTSGFYHTGSKQLFEMETKEGYSVKATDDHRFLKQSGDWCELKDLCVGDHIKLANQSDFDWAGECTFEDGWVLGFLVGDGYIYETTGALYARIRFYGEKKELIERLIAYFPAAHSTNSSVQFKHLNTLVRKFGFGKGKHITKDFESRVSSSCLKGFLRGLFDADGCADSGRLRVTLSQVNKERIYTVQRMLTYFGIRSRMQVRDQSHKITYIDGRRIYNSDTLYVLHIIGADAVAFQERIGFNLSSKSDILKNRTSRRYNTEQQTTATVTSIIPLEAADTYDINVPGAHCFAANGLMAHNCEIAWPGFLREGDPKSFEWRLGIYQEKVFNDGAHMVRVGWKDDERKCNTCGKILESEEHDPAFGGHEFIPSKNEVAYLYKRLEGLVTILHKKDCLDLPEKIYRVVDCKPTSTIKRVAKALFEVAPNVITGLTWLRELSDGFQYRDKEQGERPCDVCEGTGKTKVWEGDRDAAGTLEPEWDDHEDVCPICKGTGIVPNIVRETRQVPCPKDEAVKDLLEENDEQGRLVIFAGFKGSIDRITALCLAQRWDVVQVDGRGWKVFKVEGKTDIKPLDYWAGDAERVVFVAHPQSGGMGLTLTESRMAVFYSNDFRPDSRAQAEDRIHRIGMDNNRGATIVDLVHLPTDQKVINVLKDNRRLELMTLGEFAL